MSQAIKEQKNKETRLKKMLEEQLLKGIITQEAFDSMFGEDSDEAPTVSQPEGAEDSSPNRPSRSTPTEGAAANG